MRHCRAHLANEQGAFAGRLTLWGGSWFFLLLLLAGLMAAVSPALAQSDNSSPKPYATLDRQAVTYRGPIETTEKDFPIGNAVIGMILPMQGPQKAEGAALLMATQVALEQEQVRGPLPDGRKLALAVRDESGPWGQASSEILKLIEQDHALVLLTSPNGSIAHQAEQLANKISFPILTLASDPTTTQTNVPWLFRLGPSDTDQARAFCQRIYTQLGLRKVLLIAQIDHDGRVGRAEFEKAASQMKVQVPDVLEVSPSDLNSAPLVEAIHVKAPEAVVVWTDARLAKELLTAVRNSRPSTPVFLCSKAAQLGTQNQPGGASMVATTAKENLGESFTVVALAAGQEVARRDFEQAYRARTGNAPGITALQVFEGLHWIAAGLRATGANRVLLRDYFAREGQFHDAIVPFDPAGNNLEEFAIVKIAPQPASPAVR